MAKSSRKKYSNIKSLKDLDKAQAKVRSEYRDLENNLISNIFDPVKIGMDLLPIAFSLFKNNKNNKVSNKRKNTQQTINALLLDNNEMVEEKKGLKILNPSTNSSKGKKILGSIIRWQLIGIGVWGVCQIIKRKRKQAKLKKDDLNAHQL